MVHDGPLLRHCILHLLRDPARSATGRLADIAFQYAALAALEALQQHLHDEGLHVTLPHVADTQAAATPVSWLDDLAVMLCCPADQLGPQVCHTTSLLMQYLRILGTQVNFSGANPKL